VASWGKMLGRKKLLQRKFWVHFFFSEHFYTHTQTHPLNVYDLVVFRFLLAFNLKGVELTFRRKKTFFSNSLKVIFSDRPERNYQPKPEPKPKLSYKTLNRKLACTGTETGTENSSKIAAQSFFSMNYSGIALSSFFQML